MNTIVALLSEATEPQCILTPAQTGLVRATFRILAADSDRLAEMFYARAIALAPQIGRPRPVTCMTMQRQQLLLTVGMIVDQLDSLLPLRRTVAALARQHGLYGAGDPRFQTARAAFAWTVERLLECGPDSATYLAWMRALDLIEALLGGTLPPAPPPAAARADQTLDAVLPVG
jgi:hemoglobin-like flavoprotein